MSDILSAHDHGNCELCDALESERADLTAQLEAQKARIAVLEAEIDTHARECHPQIERLEASLKTAVEALGKYTGALDEAVEAFHMSVAESALAKIKEQE